MIARPPGDSPAAVRLGDNALYPLPLADGGWLLVDAGPDVDAPGPAAAGGGTAADSATGDKHGGARNGGDGDGGSWAVCADRLRACGVPPGAVRLVLVTHGHIDHAGLAARWAAAGARVLAGRADLPALAGGRAWLDARRADRARELLRHGYPPAERALLETWGRASLAGWRWEPCPEAALTPLDGGERFPLAGGSALEVRAAPGHTPGNLVAWEPARGVLYSGDTLLPTTIPTPGLHFPRPGGPRWPSLPPFVDSVAALAALPLERVLPGHGEPSAPAPLLARFHAHHARRARRVWAALGEGPATAYAVARHLFPHLPPERTAQAMTEVIGHLDLLVRAGTARAEDAPGGWLRYARTGTEFTGADAPDGEDGAERPGYSAASAR